MVEEVIFLENVDVFIVASGGPVSVIQDNTLIKSLRPMEYCHMYVGEI